MICVVLAAGRGTRFGGEKLLIAIGGRRLIDRALDACAGRPTIVVTAPLVHDYLLTSGRGSAANVTLVPNSEPERGMTHSLRLAETVAAAGEPLAIILADMPFVDRALVDAVIAAHGANVDVVSPELDGRPAHPVVFGPRARAAIAELPDGDSLRTIRNSKYYRIKRLKLDDARRTLDIDTQEDAAAQRAENP